VTVGEAFDVFLSYDRTDAASVSSIAEMLRGRGLKVFFDRDYLAAGQPWPDLLEKNLRACRSAAICLGPQGLGPWQKREQYVALDRQTRESEFPVIPLLLPGAKDPPLGFLRLQTWVDFRASLGDQAAMDCLTAAIRGAAPMDADDVHFHSICPYRGLEPFREEDAPFFIGREAFTKILIDKVGQEKIVGVVGASGSGKSSVVLAGLVPALRRGVDGRVWEIGVIRPGQHPLRQLAAAFLPPETGADEFARIAQLKARAAQLATGEVTLTDVVTRILEQQRGTDRLLLVVDQWEELYAQSPDEQTQKEKSDFVQVLLAGLQATSLTIVLTLRGDFYGTALQNRALADRLQDAIVNIGPMRRQELQRAVEEPASKVKATFDAGLVDQILNDVGDEPGNLPLLEFLLKELWDRQDQHRKLSFSAYSATGGVRRAIASRAEAELRKLGADQQNVARRFLVRLVSPGEGQVDTRTRIAIPSGDEPVRKVIEQFVRARLLTTSLDAVSGREVVEVGHEALIREWRTLRQWVDADREFLRTVERVKMAMRTWEQETLNKDERLLPPGRPLEEARELLLREGAEIDDIRPFIDASILADIARKNKERSDREQEQRRQLSTKFYRVIATLAGGLSAIAITFGLYALKQQWNAEQSLRIAQEANAVVAQQREVVNQLEAKNERLAEQLRKFVSAKVSPQQDAKLELEISRLLKGKERYEVLAKDLDIPWYFIGILHGLTSDFDLICILPMVRS
jgi:TIR domain